MINEAKKSRVRATRSEIGSGVEVSSAAKMTIGLQTTSYVNNYLQDLSFQDGAYLRS